MGEKKIFVNICGTWRELEPSDLINGWEVGKWDNKEFSDFIADSGGFDYVSVQIGESSWAAHKSQLCFKEFVDQIKHHQD